MGIFAAVVIPAPGGTKNPHPAGVGGFLTTPWTKADSALADVKMKFDIASY